MMKRLVIGTIATAAGILLAIFIVVLFIGHAMVSGYQDMKNAEANVPTVNLGSTFDIGGLSVSNMKVGGRYQLSDDSLAENKANGIWVVVTMHVTNNGTEARSLDSMFQELHLGDKKYTANSFAEVDADSKASVYVDPGFSDDVTLAFDVPTASAIKNGTLSFPEGATLNLSGGIGGPDPNHVNVILAAAAS